MTDRTSTLPDSLQDWAHLKGSYPSAIGLISGGKRVAENSYLHVDLLSQQDEELREVVHRAMRAAGVGDHEFNVVRLARARSEIALLQYADFFEDPFPVLQQSWLIDIDGERVQLSSFASQENPPILHRKELLLSEDAPQRLAYEELTRSLEDFGAFDRPLHLIGRKQAWAGVLADLGISIIDGRVLTSRADAAINVVRHRTAISRSRLSAPMQALARWGLIDGASIFDYGCGRGDDLRALQQAGFNAKGWDPHFAPTEERVCAEVVNLGFVLNVIEDQAERREALERAYGLATKVLAVAVMLQGQGTGATAGDGVLTTRGTFQKYYSQPEIASYIQRTLNRDPVAVAPGVFFVFRQDEDEQAFLDRRQRSRARSRDILDSMFPPRAPLARRSLGGTRPQKRSVYEANRELLESFWDELLRLGRMPEPDEFDYAALSNVGGSPKRALAALPFPDKEEQIIRARERRAGDLIVYLALNLFDQRKSFSTLPYGTQRDVRAFFGSHARALDEARRTLFATGSKDNLLGAIRTAVDQNLGIQADDGDYTFFRGKLDEQPALIRLIIGCAERLEPLTDEAELLKVHPDNYQVSYMAFVNFTQRPLPTLSRRTKIDLRRQKVWEQTYSDASEQRVLFGKSRFVPVDHPRYDTQARLDDRLRAAGIYTIPGVGTSYRLVAQRLADAGIKLNGYRVLSAGRKAPNISGSSSPSISNTLS